MGDIEYPVKQIKKKKLHELHIFQFFLKLFQKIKKQNKKNVTKLLHASNKKFFFVIRKIIYT